jgi:hypothetical protein
MKLPLLAILTFLPCVALAQTDPNATSSTDQAADSGHKHHHHCSPTEQLQKLTTKLGLNSQQQGEIGPVLISRDGQLKTMREDTSMDKDQKHEQMKALIKSSDQQIESYLTSTQVTQFEAMHHHHEK